MDEPESIDHFQPHVGRTVHLKDTSFSLVLDRVEPGPAPPPPIRQPFTLILHGPRLGPIAPEGMYKCQVEGGPAFELYLAPIHTPATDRQNYQAVFN